MNKKLIVFPLLLVMILGFLCSCGSGTKFESNYKTFVYGKNYSIPYKDKSAKFTSSDESVCIIENNQIVPLAGGYSIITANNKETMAAFITGITHSKLNVKVTTDLAKSYHNSNKITLGVIMTIENNGLNNFNLSRTNTQSFMVERDGATATSYRCSLENDNQDITDDIVIKPGESQQVIVHFLYDNVPTSITTDKKCFNVILLGTRIGAQVITEHVYD